MATLQKSRSYATALPRRDARFRLDGRPERSLRLDQRLKAQPREN